jgi:hypothetical protein
MNQFEEYSQAKYFNMLPLSDESKLKIINDFIKTGEYDKICEKKMKAEDMIIKKDIKNDQKI